MSDYDPNEAYEVVPIETGPHVPLRRLVDRHAKWHAVKYCPGKEKAERFATDPEYKASLITRRV